MDRPGSVWNVEAGFGLAVESCHRMARSAKATKVRGPRFTVHSECSVDLGFNNNEGESNGIFCEEGSSADR